jgi:Icc-related predicted phosphoesterase
VCDQRNEDRFHDYDGRVVLRFLCCSDTHGQRPPIVDETGVVAWLHGGDIVHGPAIVDDTSSPFDDPLRASAARWFAERQVPVFVVKGNHDTADELHAFRTACDVTARIVPVAPRIFVAGVGWTGERYFELPLESDLKSVCDSLRRQALRLIMPRDSIVLLTHYPPRFPGMREMEKDPPNGGIWYDCVRQPVEELPVIAVVQGHVHRWENSSQTVRCAGRDVLQFHPGRRGGVLLVDAANATAAMEWFI